MPGAGAGPSTATSMRQDPSIFAECLVRIARAACLFRAIRVTRKLISGAPPSHRAMALPPRQVSENPPMIPPDPCPVRGPAKRKQTDRGANNLAVRAYPNLRLNRSSIPRHSDS